MEIAERLEPRTFLSACLPLSLVCVCLFCGQEYIGSGEGVREKPRYFFWGKELVPFLYLFYKYLSNLKIFWSPVDNYIGKSSLRAEKDLRNFLRLSHHF